MALIRRSGFAAASLGLAFLLGSCFRGDNSLGIKLSLQKERLSNGLTVILVEDHTAPVISYQTWYRVGSVDESPGMTGISHLFEHLMFKGTLKYGPKQFFQQLEANGAEVNAFTTRDYTVYYENIVPTLLEKVIDMESDRMANLVLNEDVLKSERMVVFEERRLRTENSPEGQMQEALWALSYRRHPYHWPVIGIPQDLMAITVDQLRDYYKSHYQPANATVVVVGDFEAAKTLALLRKYYAAVPARAQPKRDIPEELEQQEERRLTLRDQIASERFAQAYHVTSAHDDDSYALDVLANILFEGTSSRAYRKLVEEKDVALTVSGSAFTPAYDGLFIVNVTMKGGIPSEAAEKLLDGVINEVQKNSVTEDEVKVAVKQLTVQLVDSVRTPYGLGQLIGTVQTILGDPYRFVNDLAKYTQVTPKDVQRVAKKYLHPNNRSIVIMAPEQEARGKR